MTKGKAIIQRFEAYCPLEMAEAGDPVGLHIGTLEKEVKRILVTLDLRPSVVKEAIEKKIDLIIAKHPPIFRPIQRLTEQDPQTKMYLDLIRHEIAVYAAHTNIDIVEDGLNDWFCQLLQIQNPTYLTKTHEKSNRKLVVFVPTEAAESVRSALCAVGAGKIGADYENCSYSVTGTGRFTPVKAAQPAIGQLNQPEIVTEERLEFLFPAEKQASIIQTLHEAHPYEEPAYDIFPVENGQRYYGLGRVGNLPKAVPLPEFIQTVKEVFNLKALRMVGRDPEKRVQRVAICGGSGEKFYKDALRSSADVYLTGDVYYHTAHDMEESGLTVLDCGHHIEELFIPKISAKLEAWQAAENWDLTVYPSEINTDPFKFY